jgi:NDMA-dependent alcohol dehydrogenase
LKVRAAVLWGVEQDWKIEEIDLDSPRAGEVLVEWRAGGLCHSDEHLRTGDRVPSDKQREQAGIPDLFPIIGGHEGAGVVIEVGPGVATMEAGDHVAASFIPSCGRCPYCVSGRQFLCNAAKDYFSMGQFTDGTSRHHLNGNDIHVMAKLGTFSERSVVAESSVIKIEPDLSLAAAALVSCGVSTGWGSAVECGGTKTGDVVVVVGVGGLGTSAVQGAKLAGAASIIAVDPVAFRRERALAFGATASAPSMAEALPMVRDLTWGQGADVVVMTPGVFYGELLQQGLELTGKGGTLVVTAMGPLAETEASIDLSTLALFGKQIKGCMFGAMNPRESVPKLLSLYRQGLLNLDDMITTYPLEQLNQGYQDMNDGTNVRGIVTFD